MRLFRRSPGGYAVRPASGADGAPEWAEIDDVAAFLGTLTDGCDPTTDTADPALSLAPLPTR